MTPDTLDWSRFFRFDMSQVKEHHVGRLGCDAVEPLSARVRDLDPMSRSWEDAADYSRKQFWLVIDEKQVGHSWFAVGVPWIGQKCRLLVVFAHKWDGTDPKAK
jgi:hypothetical protein